MPILTYLTTTHFDFGAIKMLAPEMKRLGIKRPLFVTDRGVRAAGLLDRVQAAVPEGAGLPVFDGTPGNPTESATLEALALYRSEGCDGVVCLGGGSSMDLGKAVALLAVSGEPLAQYDPMKGGGKLVKGIAPVICMPTTAGTGSEVSVGFVIILNDGRKMTFASPSFIPKVAICDPELTLGLPPLMTAATGMDAITHCIEAVLAPSINPPAEGVGLDGLYRGWRAIESAVANGATDRDARWQMMMASTEGAMAFVKGLGAVHAMSHAIGRRPDLKAHHGTLNAVILPTVLRFNESVCAEKYARIRTAMGLSVDADLARAIEQKNAAIGLPKGLAAMGVTQAMIADLVPHAASDLANFGNPRKASPDDYASLFEQAL
ncbi:MAG: iron-containing alcohol dehydrogenase [Burkholderiaceae bacterium]|jgi:4-hydroxybutyrate dehydrogenase|nr:iron-containing alcohol dehydrogenase [Burkholderiaceae bacterium]MBP8306323.1 iron-containing alcohol dehydrogenase [Burkholderiaceae bacterium]